MASSHVTSPRWWGLACGLALSLPLSAAPYRPSDPDQVLLKLAPVETTTPQPQQPDSALLWAQRQLDLIRQNNNLRQLALVDNALSPLREDHPPARLLYARVLQYRHEFDAALLELEAAQDAGLSDTNLHLQRSSLLRRQGQFDAARQACTPIDNGWLLPLCRLPLAGLSGQLGLAFEELSALELPRDPALLSWRDRELAAMQERQGDSATARQLWLRSLTRDPQDHHARSQLGWNLLTDQRYDAVLTLTGPEPSRPDMALLRILARQQQRQTEWRDEAQSLQDALLRARHIHQEVHDRELAWVSLALDDDETAVLASLRNWQLQREPEDVRLLAATHAKTGDARTSQELQAFISEHGYEDARLSPTRQAAAK